MNSACVGYQNYLDLDQCYLPQPSASADNIDLGLNNSGYPAQPHPIIVKNTSMFVEHVQCLHDQMCSIKKIYIQIYDTESEQWSYNR